jgi:TetR/AcrR family transcriptional repressor of nem operon
MDFTATQEKILKAAQDLILSKGYPATTVDEICDQAKVSKGSFYHAFSSKEDMGLALLNWYHEGGDHRLFRGPFNDFEDPMDKMFGFLDHVEKFSKELWGNGCLLASLGMELAETNPKIRTEVSRIFKSLIHRLEKIFEPASNGHSARELAEQFLVMLEGSIVLARVNKNWSVVNRGFQNFRDHLKVLSC